MKKIALTQGQVALVDDEDFAELSRFKWYAFRRPCDNTYYAARNSPKVNGRRKKLYMHRIILGATPGFDVDHRNHDGLDNQRSNLRACTRRQNCRNRLKEPGASKYRGVTWYPPTRRWRAQIQTEGGKRHLGYHLAEHVAAEAYDRAAIEHFGDFANTNFPRETYE